MDQQFDQGQPGPFELAFAMSLVGTSPTMSLKVLPEMPSNSPPKRISLARIASAVAFSPWTRSVTALASALCAARRSGFSACCCFQRLDFFRGEKGEIFQIADDVAVIGADPELVEAIDAGFLGIEPDRAGFGLAEFGAVGIGDQRQGEAEDVSRRVSCGRDRCRR